MIAINCCLSTLLFLALKDGVATGNRGCGLDHALKGVRSNIQCFAGDPS